MHRLSRIAALLLPVAVGLLPAGCGSDSRNTPALPVVLVSGATTVGEAAGSVTVTLTLQSGPDVTVDYATADGTAGAADYTPASGQVTLSAAAPVAAIVLAVADDDLLEGDETLTLSWTTSVPGVLPAATTITLVDDDALVPLPAVGSWTAVGLFHPAGDCTTCHRASQTGASPAVMRSGTTAPDPAGTDISPGTDWQHSMMAQAFNDPWYLAKVSSEAAEHPELAGFIEDKCLTCHAPMAQTLARSAGRLATLDASCPHPGGCLRLASAVQDPMSREAVSCTLCHGIDDRVLSEERDSGNYPIDPDGDTLFGPFAGPVTGAMVSRLGITPALGAHMTRSEHCRSCHDLYTPVVDATSGEPNGDVFAEQTPYQEWENSDFAPGEALAAECQTCHMPADASYATRIAVQPSGAVNTMWPERSPFARHTFVGANAHMLTVLRDFRAELGIAGVTSAAGFDRMIAATRTMLASSATLEVASLAVAGGTINADLQVTNLSGHKLPTGYPSRRMWLALVVRDAGGTPIFSSGVPDERGRIGIDDVLTSPLCTGLSAPLLACLVQHVDHVTSADQVPVYESVLADTNGDITHTLLHAAEYAKDNRLPPLGFRDISPRYDPLTAVIGVGGDADFNADGSGSDTVHYAIATGSSTGPWTLEATLYIQTVKPSYIASLHADTDLVRNFRVMMANVPPTAEVIATAAAATAP